VEVLTIDPCITVMRVMMSSSVQDKIDMEEEEVPQVDKVDTDNTINLLVMNLAISKVDLEAEVAPSAENSEATEASAVDQVSCIADVEAQDFSKVEEWAEAWEEANTGHTSNTSNTEESISKEMSQTNMERKGSDGHSERMNLISEGVLLMKEDLSMKIEVKVVSEVAKDKEAASEAVKVDPTEEEEAANPH
jgi:hypothetical protein